MRPPLAWARKRKDLGGRRPVAASATSDQASSAQASLYSMTAVFTSGEVILFHTRDKNGSEPWAGPVPAASGPLWGNARTPRGGVDSLGRYLALPAVHSTGTAAGGGPARYRPSVSRCFLLHSSDCSTHGVVRYQTGAVKRGQRPHATAHRSWQK